jgi:hypothetical protein
MGMAWWLKESFAAIYQAETRQEAEHCLDPWVHHVAQADLTEFANLWRTLTKWKEPILSCFKDP